MVASQPAVGIEKAFSRLRVHTFGHNGQAIGALNLFPARADVLDDGNAAHKQALADVATIGILQQRAARQREVLAEQLQHALGGHVIIEQAKGFLAHRPGGSLDDAFRTRRLLLRGPCRLDPHLPGPKGSIVRCALIGTGARWPYRSAPRRLRPVPVVRSFATPTVRFSTHRSKRFSVLARTPGPRRVPGSSGLIM
jgi:hypothetical protein